MRRFKTASIEPGHGSTVFFANLQQSLDRALLGLDGVPRQQVLSDQFVKGVQPTLRVHLRLARATGQLSVEELVPLARGLIAAPLDTLHSQEKGDESPVEDLKNEVEQLAGQFAALNWNHGGMLERADATSLACLASVTINVFVSDHLHIEYSHFPGYFRLNGPYRTKAHLTNQTETHAPAYYSQE
ncbi:hypothetical protein CLF_111182 [Clonorchis sinensis]|uniref:Uncharacterized protein n=1 Tax=Clonorchis sinensis TaxID=79923 RepID=G7YLH2_CLOSI|nr:hypothetical protein CLF_111182 [Clonorchis sinensis]